MEASCWCDISLKRCPSRESWHLRKKKKKLKRGEKKWSHKHACTRSPPHTESRKSGVMYKWSRARGTAGRHSSLPSRSPRIPHSSHILCFRPPKTHPPTSALKYIMKYDDCWHMGTVCACSASGPSLARCCAACAGTGSQSCANIYRGCVCFVVNHHIAAPPTTTTISLRGKDAEALIASKRGVAPVSSDHTGSGVWRVCCLMHRKQQF